MQVILPVAGKGTRMRPHTHTTPKPLVHVAGKPVIDYILDELKELDFVSDLVFITGYMGEEFEEYVRANYDFDMEFVEQETLDGSSGAVKLAEPYIEEDVLVIFTDTIFDVDLEMIEDCEDDGLIWGMEVEDYSRFGIMLTDDNGHLTEMKEKPDKPYTRLANIGMYYCKDYELMYECIQEQYEKGMKSDGEYNFPEAVGMMADRGEKFKVVEADGWYDTGKPETVLSSQRELLKERHKVSGVEDSKVRKYVYVEDGARVKNSVIGPNVSIAEGAVVKNSVVRDSIIGKDSRVEECSLHHSLIGDEALVFGVSGHVNVSDHSEVRVGEYEDNS